MPVEDSAVHERTKDSGRPYGCSNLPRGKRAYRAPNGYTYYNSVSDSSVVAEVKITEITNVMSEDCRYDLSLKDPKCSECCHRGVAEKYWAEYRERIAMKERQPTCKHVSILHSVEEGKPSVCTNCGMEFDSPREEE